MRNEGLKQIVLLLIAVVILFLAGCNGGAAMSEIDWTQGVLCVETGEFLHTDMTRGEMEQILGAGEVTEKWETGFFALYKDGSIGITYYKDYNNEIARIIWVYGSEFLVFGLSVGSTLENMIDALGEPCTTFLANELDSVDTDLYGYENIDNFNMRIAFIVDPAEGKVISIVL